MNKLEKIVLKIQLVLQLKVHIVFQWTMLFAIRMLEVNVITQEQMFGVIF
jgi:hypothetical protein